MAEYCARCGKKVSFFEGVIVQFSNDEGKGVCGECSELFKNTIRPEIESMAKNGESFFTIRDSIAEKYSTSYEGSKEYIEDYVTSLIKDDTNSTTQIKFKEKTKEILVTTCDLKEDYEIIGPVYFQVSNKGIFSSAYSELVRKYSNKIAEMKRSGNLSKEKADWGFLYGEWSVGQNDFEKAFYISVEELKKKAALLGADAIIGMRQDIDLDTNGFSYFYLQMYGTAVKYKR